MPRPQRSTRKRLIPNRLDFSRLEDRQLLAGDLTSSLQVPNSLPAETNLVANGEFELFEQGSAFSTTNAFATARFLPGSQVTGWDVSDGDGDGNSAINLLSFDNDRGTILDVDSSPGQDDRVFQDITTQAGQEYLLTFDFRNQPLIDGNTDTSTNDFDVYWNGELVASLTGGDVWQTAAFTVIGASDDPDDDVTGEDVLSRLEFRDGREGDRGGDGRGSLIHCVRLSAVSDTSVVNGGFEDVGAGVGPDFAPEDVEGFSVFNFADDAEPRVIQVVEYQPDEVPIEGENYLSVNSDVNLIDQVFQDIDTTPGETYYVTFDYRTDPDSSSDPDQLRVRWNDAWAATFIGTSEWQSVGILLDADSDLTRLTFREAGEDTGDGAGVHIDDVQIFTVNQVDQVVNDLAVDLSGTGDGTLVTQNFNVDDAPLAVAPNLVVSHDSGTTLSLAVVAIEQTLAQPTESLAFETAAVEAAGLMSEYNPTFGLLTLTGTATIAQYQTVLRTLTYQNTADSFDLAEREIALRVSDDSIQVGGADSASVSAFITLTNQNNAPTLATIDDQTVNFGELVQLQTGAADLDGDALSFSVSVDGLSASESQPAITEEGEFSWIPTEAGEFDVTVTATDAFNATVDQTFTVTVGSIRDVDPVDRNGIYPAAPGNSIDTTSTFDAVLDTDVGEITIRLLDDESPTFVNNFVNLARDGFYDGLVFHRVIEGFVSQSGDPLGTGRGGPVSRFQMRLATRFLSIIAASFRLPTRATTRREANFLLPSDRRV